jgi:hypothetical protein
MDASKHTFIFTPGAWSGEGTIALNIMEDELHFCTNWTIQLRDCAGKVQSSQGIHIQGLSEHMRNELTFYNFQNKTFSVDMENQNVGRIVGTGIYDDTLIGWEFRNNDSNFEGFETYYLQDDGSYLMRGEYVTSDQFRTQIEARIYPQSKELPFQEEPREEGEGS